MFSTAFSLLINCNRRVEKKFKKEDVVMEKFDVFTAFIQIVV
jgi:hypothetical protein